MSRKVVTELLAFGRGQGKNSSRALAFGAEFAGFV
jgi:hypothetical protein